MSADARARLEQELAGRLGRKHCVLTGRAASAIHIALCALQLKPGKVIVPASACVSPASVPLFSGHHPVFCDIRLQDFNLCPHSLRQVLNDHPDAVAIMPVHLYGQAAPMNEILTLAEEYNLPVIEDAAQGLGASYQQRPLGSWGDISVVSFGHTKTLDVGWGGAALTDDDGLASNLRYEASQLPVQPPHINKLFGEWRQVYYSLIDLTELNPGLHELFLPLPGIFKEMYLFAFEDNKAPSILEALRHLNDIVAERRLNARSYRAALQHPALHHPEISESDAPWRYSFLATNGLQKPITQALRSAEIDVSNWYPPLYHWYEAGRLQDRHLFPNADRLGAEVINVWVNPGLPGGRIEQTAEIIHDVISRHLQSAGYG